MDIKSLFKDPGRYVKAFKIFRDRCDEFRVFSEWVDGVFSEAVVGKLHTALDGQDELRVLGVGSGSGEMDCVILEQLLKQFSRINNRVVEPLPEHVDQYKALVQSKAHELHGVECDFRQQTFEQYEKAGDSTKFRFIGALHSIYYIAGDVDSALMKLYDRLVPGGVMLVNINSDECKFSRFQGQLKSSQEKYDYTTSADVRGSLDRRGIPYTQHPVPVRVDITACFDRASEKEEGALLLDFLTHIVDFRNAAPEDMQRSVMECLSSSDCSERKDGAVLLNMDWDAVIISKPV